MRWLRDLLDGEVLATVMEKRWSAGCGILNEKLGGNEKLLLL